MTMRQFKLVEFMNPYFCHFLVCDLANCELPEVPHCEDGQSVVLKNPGECQPIHDCGMTFTMLLQTNTKSERKRARLHRHDLFTFFFPH